MNPVANKVMKIAIALNKLGITTTLIAGPTNLISQKGLNIKKVTTADEMLSEIKKLLPVDLAVCAAAVADFRPIEKNKSKIKKNEKSYNL